MLCERCGKKSATVVIRQNINGRKAVLRLCADCAEGEGYGDFFANLSGVGKDFENVFGNILGESYAQAGRNDEDFCPRCGARFSELSETGKIGCAECYRHFRPALMTSIQRIHGKTGHTGKVPRSAGEKAKRRSRLSALRTQLNTAIETQDFEEAAKLRDAIRAEEAEGREDA